MSNVCVEEVTRATSALCSLGERTQAYKLHQLQLQSDDVVDAPLPTATTAGGAAEQQEQTVTFTDNELGAQFTAPMTQNKVALVDGTTDVALGDFLSRPTLITDFTWPTSAVEGNLSAVLPWSSFLGSTAIRKKIDNYAFLRGNLHVKVLMNGTPFQYGALRVAYEPLTGFNTPKVTPSTNNQDTLTPYSQMPGFFVYPQANAGGEMVLPFVLHKNWLNITSSSETDAMGTLRFVVYSPLRLAIAGASSAVTVRVYAWMSNVELMGPTSKLALQAKDEYGQGVISRPASAMAAVASTLSQIPVIGPFARATGIGLGAVSAIASLFGYTNVPVIEDVRAVIPMNGPMLASSEIGTAVQKLSLDPKQELSIDPAPHGAGNVDELTIAYLKQKESFLTSVEWTTANTINDQLYAQRVTPQLFRATDIIGLGSTSVGTQQFHIPLSYIGNLFRNWRGDLIVRIKVVCTKYHKGRLQIQYDPVNNITSTAPPENTVYTQILDIGEKDDVEVRIPYHQDWPWLSTNHAVETNWTSSGNVAPRRGIDNGSLTIRVNTALTAPSTAPVRLLIFVRGAENFEFANPLDKIGTYAATPQFLSLQAADETDIVSSPLSMGPPTQVDDQRYGLNFGESVLSLRQLLHRYSVVSAVSPPVNAANMSVIQKIYKRMPPPGGVSPGFVTLAAKKVTAGTINVNYAPMHPMAYVTGMYAGYRGSTNYVVTFNNDLYTDDVRITRYMDTGGLALADTYASVSESNFGDISDRAYQLSRNFAGQGTAGMAINSTRTNNSISFNLPDYNNYNFSLVVPSFYAFGSGQDGTAQQGAKMAVTLFNTDSTTGRKINILTMAGSGPDFTCLFFVACPTLFVPLTPYTP